jgi:RND family efflux transporter MFP subunit
MKTKILFLTIFIATACGSDKQAQLEALKGKRDKINVEIEKLEAEIAASADSASIVNKATFVSIAEMEPTKFSHYIEVQGRLDGDQNIAVYPESMGNIVEVKARVGQHVSAGQVLAYINDAGYREQLKSLETNYNLAKETFLKQENLWKQQIGSEMQYLQAKASKESYESQIAALKKQVDMTVIKSPISGTVEESLVKVGEAVSPSFPAFRVVNFSDLKVTAEVAEANASKISTGDEVIVYLPDIKKEILAKVTFTSKYINPVNRTYTVEAKLKTTSENLKANMVAVVKIKDYEAAKTCVLPVNLVQTDNKGQYVLIAEPLGNLFVAKKQFIQTGQIYNGLAEITDGLKSGQRVITAGYMSLDEGESVRF